MNFTPCPKPRPALLDRRERDRDISTTDRRERVKCHKRSGGQCEVVERKTSLLPGDVTYDARCQHNATQNHHLKGGIGVRNRGASILAKHRIDVCARHHREITAHVLRPIGPGREDAATVVYERAR